MNMLFSDATVALHEALCYFETEPGSPRKSLTKAERTAYKKLTRAHELTLEVRQLMDLEGAAK